MEILEYKGKKYGFVKDDGENHGCGECVMGEDGKACPRDVPCEGGYFVSVARIKDGTPEVSGETVPSSKAKQTAKDHWGWVDGLIKRMGQNKEVEELLRYVYLTAFEHGWKHALEDKEPSKPNLSEIMAKMHREFGSHENQVSVKKAVEDMMSYGTGAVKVEHVPVEDIVFKESTTEKPEYHLNLRWDNCKACKNNCAPSVCKDCDDESLFEEDVPEVEAEEKPRQHRSCTNCGLGRANNETGKLCPVTKRCTTERKDDNVTWGLWIPVADTK